MALASGYRLGSIREHTGNVFSLGHFTVGFLAITGLSKRLYRHNETYPLESNVRAR
jgi:hypothetical protein